MRVLVLATFLLQGATGRQDSWFGVDKLKHFFVSAFIQSVSYSALRSVDAGHREAMLGAACVTTLFAVGKEVHDVRSGSFFSTRDLVWDAAGAGSATLLLDRTRR